MSTTPHAPSSASSNSYHNGNGYVVNNDIGDRIDNDNAYTPQQKYKTIDIDNDYGLDQPPRIRRFSTTGLTEKDDKMLSNLLEKLEHVSGSLPGPEAHIQYHRKWRPMVLEPTSAWQRWWVQYLNNPLIPPVEISPEVQSLSNDQIIFRMSVMYARKLLAEAVGSFVNAYWAGSIRILALSGNIDLTGVGLQISGMIIAMIYSMAHISGGHFNTAVTYMFALKGIFPWKWVFPYAGAQLLGAYIGGWLLHAMYGPVTGGNSVNYWTADVVPHYTVYSYTAMFQEAITFWLLGLVVLMGLKQIEKIGIVFGIIIGWTLISIGLINGVYTGWSSSPTRTVGPCLVFGNCYTNEVWVYVAGPLIGATAACFTTILFDHKNRMIEKVACCGGGVSPEYT